ncbi:MAG: hypothetical protein EXS18_07460 [Verrucomicrobiae bacterium]|nr:hypothetical protein [Verrucomicrobiae bacterium]
MKPIRLLLAVLMFVPLLSSAKTVALPPPPGELVLREINYTASLSDAEARFVAEIDLESLNRSEASMPLLDGEVAVLTTKLPDGLRIVRDGNVYRVVASKQARFKFKLEFVSKITRAEPWNQTAFVGPAAAIASVNAQASGTGMEVQLLSGTARETASTNGLARVSGFLGSDRAVSLRWQSKATEAAHKAVVTCETIASAQITPNVIKFNTQLKYDIVQGSVARLTLALPAGQALTKLQGAQIRDWQTKTEGDRQILTVEFIKPIEKSYSLTLFSEQSVDATPLSAQLVPPQPLDITRESGSFSVAAEDVTVETESVVGLRQINATTGTLAAYQFYARPFSLGLRLRRIEAVVTSFSRVTARLEEARLLVKHAVTLNVEKAGIYSVEFGPIGNFIVADVRGDGIEDWKSANGKLSINFSNRALGTRVIEVQLEQAMKAFPEQIEVAPLHLTGAGHESAQIGAASTPGIRLKTGELSGLSEIPITSLVAQASLPVSVNSQSPQAGTPVLPETLAYASVQSDWKLTLAAERLSSRVIADIFNLVTIGDGLVGGSAAIRYVIVNQGVQEFRVKVPAHWKNIEFTGPNIRRKEPSGDTWTISLQDKAWGGYTLVVTYDFQFDPHKATLPVGGIHALDVERETGSVAVTSAANLQLAVKNAKEPLRRIDEYELAEPDRALISRPVLQAFRYDGADYDLALDVTRFDELAVLDAVADRTQLTTVLTDSGQMLTQASFMVKNNDKQFQRFTMPKGADFWSCYVANQPVKPERDGETLLVPLPRGANRDQAFSVEIVYALKIGSLKTSWPSSLALVAPVTDMQTTYAEWELYVPQTHRLANFGGNMTVARGTTYGLRDAWRGFLAFYDDLLEESGSVLIMVGAISILGVAIMWALRSRKVSWVALLGSFAVVLILAAMLLPAIRSAGERARSASCLNNAQQIGLSMHLYAQGAPEEFAAPSAPATAAPPPMCVKLRTWPSSGRT